MKHGLLAISPLVVFVVLYLGGSLLLGDFYKIPVTVAFLISSAYALFTLRGMPLTERIERFSAGAGDKNLLLMVWIFVLAGAFAQGAREIGAIDAVVNLTFLVLPEKLLLAGIFLAACFVSLSVGTSVGTVVALTPVAVGLAEKAGIDTALMVGVVVSGSFFGDNLSFISDTTIAATQTQGCRMSDKFRANLRIVIVPALLCFALYVVLGLNIDAQVEVGDIEPQLIFPYLLVLIAAVAGMNVVLVLLLGIVACGIIGTASGTEFFAWFDAMGKGIVGMGELVIMTLLAGGMLEVIRFNGGIDYLIGLITRRVSSQRGAELSIAALVSATNLCTANNTVAIITVGPIARQIARKFGVDKRRAASLLDTFSCVVQGLIPYGAQLLIAGGLAGIASASIVAYLYYPMLLGVCSVLYICFAREKTSTF